MHPLHDPSERVLVAMLGDWELRQFAASDARSSYFTKKGYAHLQLWHPTERVSVLTPSRLTLGNFEVCSGNDRFAASTWPSVEHVLRVTGVPTPGRCAIRSLERWFILPTETRAGRVLRSWWSGVAESAR